MADEIADSDNIDEEGEININSADGVGSYIECLNGFAGDKEKS